MTIPELTAPIQLYWDIGPERGQSEPFIRKICSEIRLLKVLNLHITEQGPAISRTTFSILESMKGSQVAISLVLPRSALNAPALDVLQDLKVKAVLVQVLSAEELNEVYELHRHRPVGISFYVHRSTISQIPRVVSFCLSSGISNLVFPMHRSVQGQDCFVPSPRELAALSDAIGRLPILSTVKVTIHDPFLWRAFYPSRPFPNGGCQAGNTLLFISPTALVYPCPSLPEPLGNLAEQSLGEIVCHGRKKDLRSVLRTVPRDCLGCSSREGCVGGCRGRALAVEGSLERRDPACSEKH